ncbi:hypothetical protein PHYBLDRAFT_159295 [Phycomyces blakesleeanus NRRL 1555(-)]|uniref:Uncharacterized protein n=1 Tax=Phycomyces blakesleeanus (strain ATCC 8743b / DSM 1359 / FGSC 10004 / NBRC 33097 / NRRL 1555) TaxID=763407 RepID=A0A167M2P4_PHYB8|nr:hypothetical protein PHYBLDRAFT_159295 [Phycomyces blakesleeanus NRRL 1555(-)]OAD71587.1 hypothetical protein PHYBLDRAFT_159295 [Phycomyces blakesleeanus NRRL 1555(-)]|eukprot:XP_018289627.1 hypothetical protein PHYBLDRAFT_159295 [Phycomyces blakesleeanus NRRL 1555(-)]
MFGATPSHFYNISQITARNYTKTTSGFCSRRGDLGAALELLTVNVPWGNNDTLH